jgi:superfamily I DNA and/or RNA helicase
VIVEEAAKAWPTELAMPLACGTAWTLIGDHKQLGAHRRQDFERFLADCADDPSPELAGLAEDRETYLDAFDTFRRLFAPLEDKKVGREPGRLPLRRLSTQFRMRQPISEVVSRVFYPAKGPSLPDGLPPGGLRIGKKIPALPVTWPPDLAGESVIWLNTAKVPDCSDDEPRWVNQGEARLVNELVSRFQPQPVAHRHGYSAEPLAVLTPYRRQYEVLRGYSNLHDHVSTVHAFQGREADLVVVSLVRDHRHGPEGVPWSSLGHLTQPNLVNVMMSRARRLLVIVGNFEHFAMVDRGVPSKGEEDGPFWGRLCRAIELYGQVLEADSVISS